MSSLLSAFIILPFLPFSRVNNTVGLCAATIVQDFRPAQKEVRELNGTWSTSFQADPLHHQLLSRTSAASHTSPVCAESPDGLHGVDLEQLKLDLKEARTSAQHQPDPSLVSGE